MKRLITILLLGAILVSCGTKKRTVAVKKETRVTTGNQNNTTSGEGLYPMPADTGEFVKFPVTSIEDYITTFAEIAQFEMKAYGIPASITLAQGILESGFGRGELNA